MLQVNQTQIYLKFKIGRIGKSNRDNDFTKLRLLIPGPNTYEVSMTKELTMPRSPIFK